MERKIKWGGEWEGRVQEEIGKEITHAKVFFNKLYGNLLLQKFLKYYICKWS